MEPGDVLFFHSNLLHTSEQNHSMMRRWVMITSYCQARNNPTKVHHCPQYNPLNKVANSAIMESARNNSVTDKVFMDPGADKSSAGLKRM